MLTCPDCGIANPDDWHTCVQYENNQKFEKQIKVLQMQVENLNARLVDVEGMIEAYGRELLYRAPWKAQ
jgi:ubiquinone biosynthesis protein UbiJ